MKKNVNLYRQVFEKDQFNKTIDTKFNELNNDNLSFFSLDLATVNDLFLLYDKYFLEIPKTGNNSHQQLVNESSNYINSEAINEEINALLGEIDSLKRRNIKLSQMVSARR